MTLRIGVLGASRIENMAYVDEAYRAAGVAPR